MINSTLLRFVCVLLCVYQAVGASRVITPLYELPANHWFYTNPIQAYEYGVFIGAMSVDDSGNGFLIRVDRNGSIAKVALEAPVEYIPTIPRSWLSYDDDVLSTPLLNGSVVQMNLSTGSRRLLHEVFEEYAELGTIVAWSDGTVYYTTLEYPDTFAVWVYKNGVAQCVYSYATIPADYMAVLLFDIFSNSLIWLDPTGGAIGVGGIYQRLQNGSVSILHSFAGYDGTMPLGLITNHEGMLYGTTRSGGGQAGGSLFSYSLKHKAFQQLYSFDYDNLGMPFGSPAVGDDEMIYGFLQVANHTMSGLFRFDPNTTKIDFAKDNYIDTALLSMAEPYDGLGIALLETVSLDGQTYYFKNLVSVDVDW